MLRSFLDLVLDHLISCNKLEECARTKMRDTLLRRHRHQKSQGIRKGLSNIIGKNRPSANQYNSASSSTRKSSTISLPTEDKEKDNGVYATFPTGKKPDADRVLPYQVFSVVFSHFLVELFIHGGCFVHRCSRDKEVNSFKKKWRKSGTRIVTKWSTESHLKNEIKSYRNRERKSDKKGGDRKRYENGVYCMEVIKEMFLIQCWWCLLMGIILDDAPYPYRDLNCRWSCDFDCDHNRSERREYFSLRLFPGHLVICQEIACEGFTVFFQRAPFLRSESVPGHLVYQERNQNTEDVSEKVSFL